MGTREERGPVYQRSGFQRASLGPGAFSRQKPETIQFGQGVKNRRGYFQSAGLPGAQVLTQQSSPTAASV